jgi:hypothetical protein
MTVTPWVLAVVFPHVSRIAGWSYHFDLSRKAPDLVHLPSRDFLIAYA